METCWGKSYQPGVLCAQRVIIFSVSLEKSQILVELYYKFDLYETAQ